MRIAQLTLNVYGNYGNMLQKYALNRTLKKFAEVVEVLWNFSTKPYTPYELEINRFYSGSLKTTAFNSVRESRIKNFSDTHMQTRFDLPYLEDVADEYDFFVVGSDQVWNPDFEFPGRFLDFAPPEKRIAYAASISVSELPADVEDYWREKISEMPHVSIRELEGVELVEKLTGKRPLHVLDPVFLLTADEWREIEKPPAWLSKKIYRNGYLLTYFFKGKSSEQSELLDEQVKRLAEELNLPTINLLDSNNFDHFITSVEEFLYLVNHATFLCTNSFHGTSFAIIFKRPFILYKFNENTIKRFSRLQTVLELFNLQERATDTDLKIKVADPLKIDFTRRDEVLPLERAKAFNFLSAALKTHQKIF